MNELYFLNFRKTDLKRFSPTERYRGKLSVTVDFPLTSLDLSPYAANKGQGCTYNLYAISNHSGTAYGGHYTAYCKHPYTGNWHEYNDSRYVRTFFKFLYNYIRRQVKIKFFRIMMRE